MARQRWRVALEALLWSTLVSYAALLVVYAAYVLIFIGPHPQHLLDIFRPSVAMMLIPALAPVIVTGIVTVLHERFFSLMGAMQVGSLAWVACFFVIIFIFVVFDMNAGGMGFSLILLLPWLPGWLLLPVGFGIAYRRLNETAKPV